MSVVVYNGVTLPYPLHSSFQMETVYDDSGTDWQYLKIDITVQCVIGPDYWSTISPQLLASDKIADATRWIRNKLLTPKASLSVKVGGKELIPARQDKDAGNANRTVDAKHGPLPLSCTLTAISEETFLLTYRISAHYWENYEDAIGGEIAATNRAGNPVVSCRWSDSQEIDGRNFSKRIREGLIVIRSDNVEKTSIDNFRENFAVVGIPIGFVRKASSFTVDPNGLKMRFRLEDQEVYLMPPFPAYEASGTYTETLAKMGAKRYGECTVELKGRKSFEIGESKSKLIETAITICLKKLIGAKGKDETFITVNGPKYTYPGLIGKVIGKRMKTRVDVTVKKAIFILEQAILQTDLYDNTVRVTMRFQLSPGAAINGSFEMFDFETISQWPSGSEPGTPSPQIGVYGNPDVDSFLKAAAYFDPSLQQKLDNSLGQLTPTPQGVPGTGNA